MSCRLAQATTMQLLPVHPLAEAGQVKCVTRPDIWGNGNLEKFSVVLKIESE